jgi:hypothetical protein
VDVAASINESIGICLILIKNDGTKKMLEMKIYEIFFTDLRV